MKILILRPSSAAALIHLCWILITLTGLTHAAPPDTFQFQRGEYADIKEIALKIVQNYPPDEYIYVGLGRSPSAITAFLNQLDGVRSTTLPASEVKNLGHFPGDFPKNGLEQLRTHLVRFLGKRESLNGKKVLLFDHVDTAEGLKKARLLTEKLLGLDHPVIALGLECSKVLKIIEPDPHYRSIIYGSHNQYDRFASSRYEGFAPYPRAPLLNPDQLAEIKPNPGYEKLVSAMQAEMGKDRTLIKRYRLKPGIVQAQLIRTEKCVDKFGILSWGRKILGRH